MNRHGYFISHNYFYEIFIDGLVHFIFVQAIAQR